MIIRDIQARDYEKLRELHVKAPAKYELMEFDGRNFVLGLVAVDDDDIPRVLLCFQRVAEAQVVVDHGWDVPHFRLQALAELIETAKPRMVACGYDEAVGTVGPGVPRRYLDRLKKLGCGIFSHWTLVKFWKGR